MLASASCRSSVRGFVWVDVRDVVDEGKGVAELVQVFVHGFSIQFLAQLAGFLDLVPNLGDDTSQSKPTPRTLS